MGDESLSLVLTKIARHYSRDNQVAVNTSFVPPKIQEMQITEGGAADILITPKQAWIEQLKTQGLVDIYSQITLAHNRLVLVGPANSTLQAKLAEKFPTAAIINQMAGESNFAVANPESLMEGAYAKEALSSLGAAADMEPYTLYIKTLSDMFGVVTERKGYGVFLYTNAYDRPDLQIIDTFPATSHKPIDYYAVVIAGDNMDEARKFLAYLQSGEAKRVLKEYGFVTE